ncbi:hypothetical protein DER29_0629 [Micromonospora sp. M71_S20]|uniref:hypothetical protein n=1 Tax=Micromonospora sp. M71_S20 TaxID=592872 RepID=UPI000EB0B6DE|nr:hypothetical protein [Micromonospora sp. M71_S20]RLK22785.1 hypothetical protein DER29_0629 [Micromonospora sp. M71_S20]
MSYPPANSYPPPDGGGGPYGSYPPQQPGGYGPPPQAGGYDPLPPQPGGYGPPQQSGAYGPPPQSGGYPPQAGGFAQPPSGGVAGAPYGGPPVARKSNAGKIVLISLAVVLVLCLGGAAIVAFAVKDEVKETVDATRIRVVAPATLAGRPKATDPALQAGARQLEAELNKTIPEASSTVGGFYGTLADKDLVMIAAASGLNPNPARTLEDTIRGARTSDVRLGEMSSVDPGPLGGEAKCGDAKAQDVPLGVCVWSDKGSVGMVIIYFKTGQQAHAEFATIRGQVEQKS